MRYIFSLLCGLLILAVALGATPRDPFLQPKSAKELLLTLHYADAAKVAKEIKNSFLSTSGYLTSDKRTNSLWVSDDASHLRNIEHFVTKIDIPLRQVMITARIVDVEQNFVHELGVEFRTSAKNSNNKLSMDLPAQELSVGHFGLAIAKLSNDTLLNMEISALESEGRAKVISKPRIVTLNRETAHIAAGEEIPYQEKTGEGNTSVAFKKAVLGLEVTPTIISNNKILLNIKVNEDNPSSLTVEGVPAIQTKELTTEALVNDKQTVVLGGIYSESKEHAVERIPFLSSLPLFGILFRKQRIATEKKELLIFITPKIL